MKNILLLAMFSMLILSACFDSNEPSKDSAMKFPLAVGNEWHYDRYDRPNSQTLEYVVINANEKEMLWSEKGLA